MSKNIHNKKGLKIFRKELRNNLTSAEATLWKALQGKQVEGYKFRRQHSVGSYILDFYCPAARLDGEGHFCSAGMEADAEKESYLDNLDIKVLRFENRDVFGNLESILEEIKDNLIIRKVSKDL